MNSKIDKNLERFLIRDKYWFTLAVATYHGGIKSCLNLLHNNSHNPLPRDKKQLYISLVQQKPFLFSLLNHGIIRFDEWDILFPKDEMTDSSQFDLGMIIALLQAICLRSPTGGWMDPDTDDIGISSFVVKLRQFKDKLGEYKNIEEINVFDYHTLWEELCEILHGLECDITEIHEVYVSTRDEQYQITKNIKTKFAHAIKRTKLLFIWKKFHDIKAFYTKHLSNVCTVMSVVKYNKVDKVHQDGLRIKHSICQLEDLYDYEANHKYKSISRFLLMCEKVSNEIQKNEASLDAVIISYNKKIEKQELKLIKASERTDDDKKKRRFSNTAFTFKKSAAIGWLRRNTIRGPPRANDYNFTTEDISRTRNSSYLKEIDMGDY